MRNSENPDFTEMAASLAGTSVAEVLLYGLTLDDEDPALGIIVGARRELGLITTLAEASLPGIDVNMAEIVPVLEGIVRRLDVAVELTHRARRTRSAVEPVDRTLTHELKDTAYNGKGVP